MPESHATAALRVPVSWRVRFAYRGDDFRPVAADQLQMIAPGGTGPSRAELGRRSGAYIEVIAGGASEARWSRAIAQPNRADREVFLEDGGFTRVEAEPNGDFDLLIPDYGPDATFVLYASPARAPGKPAEPRVKLRLSDLRRLGRIRRGEE